MKCLQDCLLKGGIKGKVFSGRVGGKIREYIPVKISLDFIMATDSNKAIWSKYMHVRLVTDDERELPKHIFQQRKRVLHWTHFNTLEMAHDEVEMIGYSDYRIPIATHAQDPFVKKYVPNYVRSRIGPNSSCPAV